MITIDDIRAGRVRKHRVLFSGVDTNSDGTPQRWKVTSIKTWKTRPTEFVLGVSRGLYQHDRVTDTNGWAEDLFLTESEAEAALIAAKALREIAKARKVA